MGEGNEEEGLALLQGPTGLAGVRRKVGWLGGALRAGPRLLLRASSDSHHLPCHQWRFPGKQ